MSEAQTNEKTEDKRLKSDVNLDDLMGKDLKLTGADLPDGSYPAILFGFGEPFRLPVTDQFKKEGGPTHKDNFDMRFGTIDKQGNLVEVTYMCGIPDGGEVNRKSNLFKALSSLSNGDEKIMSEKTGLAKGVRLSTFIGKPCVLNIKKNKKDFPQIESIARPMDGVKYPTVEDCKALLTSSQGIPF